MSFDGRLLSGMSVLAAVVEAGSFSRAGDVLGLSASGVSRSISRLEERLGVRLLDRTTRTLHLTSDGANLYERAAPHLAGIEEAASYVSGASVTVRGTLRVSLNPIFARHVLAPNLPLLRQRHPGLELMVVQAPDIGDLVTEGIDVAVRFGPQPPSTMTSRLLLQTRVLTVASPAYLARHGRPKRPEKLAEHDCIQYIDPRRGRPFGWEFHRGREVLRVDTRGPLTTTDVDLMVQACLNGAGVAQVLALNVRELLADRKLVELFPEWNGETYPLYVTRPSRRLAPAAVEAFLDFCSEICAGL
ncbi:LysR family transcriptional regulator [Achromobacter sp. SIMBA_011]|jgi:DNA-binding transcriptional LysR family regulator|uniref:HTH-type transcriptional regulator PgrR n=1 Tax=Achromobacter dolens TaxID=1287738 RepID=A0A6S7C494_9BURK|nr:LysR family transcriptional regulator [Achromobacter dolens]CAB3831911.1 HTH-type transcriptional regulator PgrR [Achromobacter dolens]CUJ23961.1 D-malate degradation protein R [Achromobacter dolens]